MVPQKRRRQGVAPIASLLLALTTRVNSLCSTENTGAGFGPHYDMYQSHLKCQGYCSDGYVFAYAVVQGFNCWCSNYAPATSGASCTKTCPGYDQETCGTIGSAYDYVYLNNPILGTSGASLAPTPSQSYSVSTPQPSSSPPPPPAPETTTQLVTGNPIIIPDPTTKVRTQATQITRIERITVSGGVTYVTLTPTATPPPQAPEIQEIPHQTGSSGLSGGAVAGIVIGVVAALLILGLAIFFLCCRPRKQRDVPEGSPPTRNSSVLSKVGLLRSNPTEPPAAKTPVAARSAPQIRTQGLGFSSGPNSATTAESQMSENRRHSRPLFVDNRLNPNALFEHNNASRTSVGTLQDDRDYSRPLEVRNPDR